MPTKKQRKEAMRELIDRQPYEEFFSEEDVESVNRLTGWRFPVYKRAFNQDWPKDTRCVAHSTDGVTWEVWSWNKAIDNYGSFQDVLEAMRLAIQPQMQRYAATAPNNCAVCSAEDFLSVDHKDRPFIVMARDFMKANERMNEAVDNDATGKGWYIRDPEMKERWVLYHKVNATYQVLCRSCNSKKGAKHDASERQT